MRLGPVLHTKGVLECLGVHWRALVHTDKAPEGLTKIDRSGKAEAYNLFVSLLVWADNPMRDALVSILEEYCQTMLQ